MCNIVIWHLYTLEIDHYDESSNNQSPYKIITILLTILSGLYITSPWLIYFITGSLYLWIPFTYFDVPSPLATTSFSVSISLYLFCLFCFLDSTYKWNHTIKYIYIYIYIYIIRYNFISTKVVKKKKKSTSVENVEQLEPHSWLVKWLCI